MNTIEEIKPILKQRFDAVLNLGLKECSKELYFAGGCIPSLLRGETPKDYDLYAVNTTSEAISCIRDTVESTWSLNALNFTLDDIKYQLITSRVGKPADVVKTFDFLHTHTYYHQGAVKFLYEADKAIESGTLVYTGSKSPIYSILRAFKFIKRGWTIADDELLKLIIHSSRFDLSNPDDVRKVMPVLSQEDAIQVCEFVHMLDSRMAEDIGRLHLYVNHTQKES